MTFKNIFDFNPGFPEGGNPLNPPFIMMPIDDVVKLQKGYIEHLELKLSRPSTMDGIEDLTHKLKKMSRDSAMKLADVIRDALVSEDYDALAELEKHIRKQSFGKRDSEGI